jgi:Tfp pilus assembly major pilin PilA
VAGAVDCEHLAGGMGPSKGAGSGGCEYDCNCAQLFNLASVHRKCDLSGVQTYVGIKEREPLPKRKRDSVSPMCINIVRQNGKTDLMAVQVTGTQHEMTIKLPTTCERDLHRTPKHEATQAKRAFQTCNNREWNGKTVSSHCYANGKGRRTKRREQVFGSKGQKCNARENNCLVRLTL